MSRGKQKKKHKKGPTMAEQADIHVLYEESVQNVQFEVEFVADTFKSIRGRDALTIREDFCGTAQAACEWVRQGDNHTAIGVDLDPDVLAWGRKNHVAKLKPKQAARISLLNQNVLDVETDAVDAILAMNFSYWCFKRRADLLAYFKNVYQHLNDQGLIFLDAFGGYEAYEEMEEETEQEGFTYIWDQARYNPATGDLRTHIHFEFPDGSEIRPAFTYDWRLWSLPEIREILEEAGFKNMQIYSEGWDDEAEEGSGQYSPVKELEADPGWVVYLAAEK